MLRSIKLYGNLKELYSGDIEFDVDTVAEAIRACIYQIDGFENTIRNGEYRISLNADDPENDVDESIAPFNLGSTVHTIHIIPVMAGAKRGGIGKVVLGVAMIGLAVATGGGSLTLGGGAVAIAGSGVSTAAGIVISTSTIASLGVSMVLGGVSQLLTPQVGAGSASNYESVDQRASFLFNGPVNTSAQGAPVPLVYGRIRTGSHVVSSGLVSENI